MGKSYPASFKVKVAVEATAGQCGVSELASRYEISPKLVHDWKKQLLSGAAEIFSDKRRRQATDDASKEGQLFEEIGRLKFELDWLKKKSDLLLGH